MQNVEHQLAGPFVPKLQEQPVALLFVPKLRNNLALQMFLLSRWFTDIVHLYSFVNVHCRLNNLHKLTGARRPSDATHLASEHLPNSSQHLVENRSTRALSNYPSLDMIAA